MSSAESPPPLALPARLLLTGAAGRLGQVLREPLRAACGALRLSDRAPWTGPLEASETYVACDLADRAGMRALLEGVDAVVHMGGVSVEGPFDPILEANIVGAFHLYEAARVAGVRRIVFASSNHVTGCYAQGERVHPRQLPRPDGYYGVSKLVGEHLAQLYFDRYGIESVCLRIGTAAPEPPDRRALSTWLSYPDLVQLVLCSLRAPDVGCLVAYGVSANPAGWWDTALSAARLGYRPQDSAEVFRAHVEALPPVDTASPTVRLQGGSFLGIGPFDTFGAAS